MSEELRKQFEEWFEENTVIAGFPKSLIFKLDYAGEYIDSDVFMHYRGFKACANIKDAEIARVEKQSADRLIGLCKCGIEHDELQKQVAMLRDGIIEAGISYRKLIETPFNKQEIKELNTMFDKMMLESSTWFNEQIAKAKADQREKDVEIVYELLDDPYLSGHGYANACAEAIRNQC